MYGSRWMRREGPFEISTAFVMLKIECEVGALAKCPYAGRIVKEYACKEDDNSDRRR